MQSGNKVARDQEEKLVRADHIHILSEQSEMRAAANHDSPSQLGGNRTLADLNNLAPPQSSAYSYDYHVTPTPVTDILAESKFHTEVFDPPKDVSIPLSTILIKSEIPHSLTSNQRITKIIHKFNHEPTNMDGEPRISSEDIPVGKVFWPTVANVFWETFRLAPNEMALVARNRKPALIPYSDDLLYLKAYLDPTVTVELLGRYNLNNIFFGAYGSRVLVVPEGHYALVVKDDVYLIYDEGTHVLHANSSFKFKTDKHLIPKSKSYIQYGSLNVLSVGVGQVAKVMADNQYFLMEARLDPYVFRTARFKFDGFAPANQKVISYHSLKRVYPQPSTQMVLLHNNMMKVVNLSDALPLYLKNEHENILGFLAMGMQRSTFPLTTSPSAAPAMDLTSKYKLVKSLDGVQIKLQLIVRYQLKDPEKLLKSGCLTFNNSERDEIANFMEEFCLTEAVELIQGKNLCLPLPEAKSSARKSRETKETKVPSVARVIDKEQYDQLKKEISAKLTESAKAFAIHIESIKFDMQASIENEKLFGAEFDYSKALKVLCFFQEKTIGDALKNIAASTDTENSLSSTRSALEHHVDMKSPSFS